MIERLGSSRQTLRQKHSEEYGRRRRSFCGLFCDYICQGVTDMPVKEYLERIMGGVDGVVLDVGAGMYPTTYLPEMKGIVCLDWVQEALAPGNSRVLSGESRVVGYAEQLPFPDETFSAVLSKQLYGYLLEPDRLLPEMSRALKPGGLFVLIDIEGEIAEYFKDRQFDFYPELLKPQLAQVGIRDIIVEQIDHFPDCQITPEITKTVDLTALIGRKIIL